MNNSDANLRDQIAVQVFPALYAEFCNRSKGMAGGYGLDVNWRESIWKEAFLLAEAMLKVKKTI